MATAEKLLETARAELGVKESPAGSNKVKYNTWYYGRTVSGVAYPWCVAFAQWCCAQAGVELLAMNSRESFNATCLFYHDRMQAEQNPAIRELLEQDRAFLDEKQVQMTLAREFYLAVRLKNEKPDTAYTLLSTIETKFRDNGFTTRRAGKEDLKRLLAIYFEQNTTTERFEDYDGQRFMEATG